MKKEYFSRPYDIKIGYAIKSNCGRFLVFSTEDEAFEFLKEAERLSFSNYYGNYPCNN